MVIIMPEKKRGLSAYQILSVVVAFCLLVTAITPAFGADPAPRPAPAEAALTKAVDYLAAVPPENTSPWVTIALRAAGYNQGHLGTVDELSPEATTTDAVLQLMQRAAAGEKSAARDELAAAIAGVQLPNGKFADVLDGRGGELVNAHIWAVLALQAAGREIPMPEAALQWLLAQQHADGGFSFAAGLDSDVDMTAMALSAAAALGVDRGHPAVGKALSYLETMQAESGGFASWGIECSESAATVLQALTALGEDPLSPRWNKPGGNILEALLDFQRPDGSFAHAAGGDADLIATCQAALALSDYVAGQPFWQRLDGNNGFTDVPPAHWAATQIKSLAAQGIIAGLPDGRFNPEGRVTRAELAAILSRALVLPTGPTRQFQDVPGGHWAKDSISAVADAGYLRGRPGGCFAPGAPVTGGEFAAILCRVGSLTTPSAASGEPWWGPSVQAAEDAALLAPDRNPLRAATRAEVAWGVHHVLKLHGSGQ